MTNIKEKVLKEVWFTNKLLNEARKIVPLEIERTKKAIDLTLTMRNEEFKKVIDDRIKDLKHVMRLYKKPEINEFYARINELKELKRKLGRK